MLRDGTVAARLPRKMDRVTFATSTGGVWLALAVHLAAGLIAIVAGTIALAVTKGGQLHKQSGLAFTWAMVVLGPTAAGIGTYETARARCSEGSSRLTWSSLR
jgi:hypothetical protein